MASLALLGCDHRASLGLQPVAPGLAPSGAATPAPGAAGSWVAPSAQAAAGAKLVPSLPAAASVPAVAASASSEPDEVIVRFRGEPRALPGATLIGPLGLPHAYLYRVNHAAYGLKALDSWADAEDILFAEPNYVYHATSEPNDPLQSQAWGVGAMAAPSVWDQTQGDGITVAVVDTGVFAHHPDLEGQVLPGVDLVNHSHDASDDQGHGTHVAGTIAAIANNGLGVAGVAPHARILPIKVLDASGQGNNATIANGILEAARRGAQVINLSLGGPDDSATLHAAIDAVERQGVIVVAAGGNDGSGTPFYPADYDGVLGIAAVDRNHQRASFSNYGSRLGLAAAGVDIASTSRDGQYLRLSGTSMACPHVAGLAALLLAKSPGLKAGQIAGLLRRTGHATRGFPAGQSAVEVDARAAVAGLAGLASQAPAAVSGLAATPGAPGAVELTWQAANGAAAITAYRVLRDGGTLATVTAPHYTDLGLRPGQSAEYRVVAIAADGNESPASPAVTGLSGAASTHIGALQVTKRGIHELEIRWKTDAPMYSHLEWGPGDAPDRPSDREILPLTEHTAILTNLARFKRYGFRVVATDAAGEVCYSELQHARTKLWFLFAL